jgi:hypothetical protein
MRNKYVKCQKCPAYHLLTDERKSLIERWENRRDRYLSITKEIRLILLGESMPAPRYFYDLETKYEGKGLRYTLKKEFGNLELDDSHFLMSMARKGIVLFDCALCPLHQLDDNVSKRRSATDCFLTITHQDIAKYPNVPIVTVFPEKRGWLKREIPYEIIRRVVGKFSFTDQTGLSKLFERIKAQ